MIFGRNILKTLKLQFACLRFHVGLLFYQLFVFQTGHHRTPKIARSLMLYQANAPTLMRYNFLTQIPKLKIFGIHYLQTLHIIQLSIHYCWCRPSFTYWILNIRPKLHHLSLRDNNISGSLHCSWTNAVLKYLHLQSSFIDNNFTL